ncbi:transposase [Streptomyces sp. NPDC002838]|uniref:IS66 family transposase n=1 Tax=Streptomyces sp. NPDC002838 TaxID=3154436 RepID=UPI00332D9947
MCTHWPLHGANLSEGFVHTALLRAAARLVPFSERVVALLQSAPVAHFDESGIRVSSSLHWWTSPAPPI